MTETQAGSERGLLDHVLVPVAQEDDALATARALEPYDPNRVTALHVVEKGGGAPDKTPVEQSEEIAAKAYEAMRTCFPQANEHTAYGSDVPQTILETAEEVDASAIAYRARSGNRLLRMLSGDHSLKLVTQADRPVIALPRQETDD